MDKSKITGLGGLLAGIVGSVCCVGPVILGGLGFGVGVIGFVRDLGFLHIPMMALAFLLLGAAFYMRYQKADPQMGNSACKGKAQESKTRADKRIDLYFKRTFIIFHRRKG